MASTSGFCAARNRAGLTEGKTQNESPVPKGRQNAAPDASPGKAREIGKGTTSVVPSKSHSDAGFSR